mgnify:CR=1 FL=1
MSREAFEAWFSDQGRFPRACEKGRDGGYLLQHANTSWSAWQAARAAALEEAARVCHHKYMELRHGVDRTDPTDDYEYGLREEIAVELREAIRALREKE